MSDSQSAERNGAKRSEARAAGTGDIAELERVELRLAMKGQHDAA
jgi:hypothetical protein